MSYGPTTDFLALLRQTSGGVRSVRMPGLDYVVEALARAGLIALSVGQTPPTFNQAATAWFKPAIPSWAAEGALYLWNVATAEYELATPALWGSFFAISVSEVVQDVTTAGPILVQTNANVVRVEAGVPVALTMPPSATMVGPVLIVDWANLAGTNNITISLSGGEAFPNGKVTPWIIAGDGGSVFLRPVPGGFAL